MIIIPSILMDTIQVMMMLAPLTAVYDTITVSPHLICRNLPVHTPSGI